MTLHPAQGQEITVESLDNGPGLLPFKLGAAKIVSHFHSFLSHIDLENVHLQIEVVKTQMAELSPLVNNKTLFLFDPHLKHLNSKINLIISKISMFESTRSKRGLIDGLGSVIKSISGNLDYTDALKYETAINTLRNNEHKLELEINNHVSLNSKFISRSSQIIDSIISNQDKMNKALNLILESNANRDTDLIKYAHLAQHLLILGDNVEDLYEELRSLENTLTFIRALSTPYSLFNSDEIKYMLGKLRILYANDEILDVEIRHFYEIIKLGYFYSNKQIVVVIKVPIVVSSTYDLYKLSLVPNRNHETLIPPSPFVALSSSDSRYIETECPKVNSIYLCESTANLQIQSKPDCIQHLIVHQELQPSCKLTPVALTTEALETLDDKHYTLSFPVPTKVKMSCGQEQYRTLRGSYLAIIPLNCNLRTPAFTISNTDDHIKGHVVKIIEMPLYNETKPENYPKLILNSPNLQKLHTLSNEIATQLPVHLDDVTDPVIYHTTIPMYLALSGTCALIATLIYRRLRIRKASREITESFNSNPEVVYAIPSPRTINPSQIRIDPGCLPATILNKSIDTRCSTGGGVTHGQP